MGTLGFHDNHSPNKPYDWRQIIVASTGPDPAMTWYGESLFTAPAPAETDQLKVRATDTAGNKTCAPVQPSVVP